MLDVCPKCNGKRLRYSRPKNAWEVFRGWLGIVAVRCRDCRHRFFQTLWDWSSWKYAHCPRCYRMDLGLWSETHFHASFEQRLLLKLGAKRYRCEVCRHNFVSFGALKERYHFHNRRRVASPADTGRQGYGNLPEAGVKEAGTGN